MENIEENEGRETGHRPACAACKLQRKKCELECVFRPYFPAEREAEFSQVQKVFGIAKVRRLLVEVETDDDRREVAASVFWEARAWKDDPVRGPYGWFKRLQQELCAARRPTSSVIMPPQPLPPPSGFNMTPEFASARPSTSHANLLAYRQIQNNGFSGNTMNRIGNYGNYPMMMDSSVNRSSAGLALPQSGHQRGGDVSACSSSDRAIHRSFGDHNRLYQREPRDSCGYINQLVNGARTQPGFFHSSGTVHERVATMQGQGELEPGFQYSIDPSDQMIPSKSNERRCSNNDG